jgi:uncharacterized membrane protein
MTKDKPAVRAGWVTVIVSLVYFVVVKKWAMTSDEVLMEGKFAYYYREMIPRGESFDGLVTTAITSPGYSIGVMVSEAKLEYVLKLLVPLLGLPLFVRRGLWISLLYGVVFLLLATKAPVFSTHFQYSSVIFPLLIGTSAVALRRIRDRDQPAYLGFTRRQLTWGLAGAMLVSSFLSMWKFGGIMDNTSFRGGFRAPRKTLTPPQREKHRRLREMVDQIPPGASVTTTNRIGAHVSNRKDVFFYRQAKITDYVLLHKRDLRKWIASWHKRRVARGELVLIDEFRELQLFRIDRSKVVNDAKKRARKRRARPRPRPKPKRARPRPPPRPRPKPKRTPGTRPAPDQGAGGGTADDRMDE